MLRTARHVHKVTGMKNLCLAGGVALNCVGNGRILREGPFEKVRIQPAAGDACGALGTALFIWHQLLDNPRIVEPRDSQRASYLGLEYSDEEIGKFFGTQARISSSSRTMTRCASMSRTRWPGGKSSDGFRGGWSSACAGQPQHHRRSARSGNADNHECEGEIPRRLPPVQCRRCWKST